MGTAVFCGEKQVMEFKPLADTEFWIANYFIPQIIEQAFFPHVSVNRRMQLPEGSFTGIGYQPPAPFDVKAMMLLPVKLRISSLISPAGS